MGLDMYLERSSRRLAPEVYDWRQERGYEYEVAGQPNFHRSHGIALYLRKQNAIHRWFVENVQGGADNCERHAVEVADLERLRDACERVLGSTRLVPGKVLAYIDINGEHHDDGMVLEDDSVAREVLPTQEGFFFGDTDYDQYYWEGLVETRDTIDQILARIEWRRLGMFDEPVHPAEPDWVVRFCYQSSW